MSILPLARTGADPHTADVFDAYCECHGGRVLLSTRRILSIDPVEGSLVVRFRCWCGAPGTWGAGRAPSGSHV